jgi:hypothetical protein
LDEPGMIVYYLVHGSHLACKGVIAQKGSEESLDAID